MDNTLGGYGGYPGSEHWSPDSRPLSESTNVLRSFVLTNIVQDNQWELDRITRYYLFWKFYDGLHYKDFNDGMLAFNYIRAFIDKVNMFLLGSEAFTFKVTSYYSSQVESEVEKLAEELIMYHWNKSNKMEVSYELLQMGGVTGDAWVGIDWKDRAEEKFCKINVYDSRQCFPQFKNGDYNDMESFLVRQAITPTTKQPYKLFVTKFTNESIETWYQKDANLDEGSTSKYVQVKNKNEYGFIPVVHIKNKPNSASFYGKSDANDILKINKVYNEITQQVKAIIDYHATPTTVITGASAKSLKRGLGQIWSGLPAEANVFNLGLDADLSSTVNFLKDLKTSMHELSDVPENALGKIQAISNTSAAALQITYQPLIQQANLKAVTYGEGIAKINTMILKILEKVDSKNTRLVKLKKLNEEFISEMRIVPTFSFGFPKDKTEELNRATMENNLKIVSRREIMARLGKENIPDLLKEIDAETINQAILQVQVNDIANSMAGENPAP